MILAAEIQVEDSQVLMASVMPLPGLQVITENVFNLKQKIWKIEPNLFSMEECDFFLRNNMEFRQKLDFLSHED